MMSPEGQPRCTQDTMVTIAEQPSDHIIWSLCSFGYGNPFCLGLMAFIHSVKARDQKMVGDLEGARRHGSTARCFNILSTILISMFFVTILVFLLKQRNHAGI